MTRRTCQSGCICGADARAERDALPTVGPEAQAALDRIFPPTTDTEPATRDAINAHIKAEAERIGTNHGDPAGTPGGTGYCIPAAVATQIVDKYLAAERQVGAASAASGGHERGYIPLIDNRLRCKVCEEVWPCAAERASGGLDFLRLVADTSNDPHLVREALARLATPQPGEDR